MAITTLAALKIYLGTTSTGDDTILTSSLARAESFLARSTGRIFDASTTAPTTRYYLRNARNAEHPRVLDLDEDLISVTTLVNGDGTTISSSDYWLLPFNKTPYIGIQLLENADGWTWDTDTRVAITGVWGLSTSDTASADTVQAALAMAAYLYRQRDAQVFEVSAQTEMGQLILPAGTPKLVWDFVRDHRKTTW